MQTPTGATAAFPVTNAGLREGLGKRGREETRFYTLLPASISWHCCPKTCEKVTGPGAEPEVTGAAAMALLGARWGS